MGSYCLAFLLLLAGNVAITAAQSSTASTTLPTLVQPTPTPIGNASNILTYPICAQICSNETFANCDPSSLECLCGATFRSETAACEKDTCSEPDFNTTALLAQQLCGPFYANNSALSSSVAAAIASATSVAVAATTGKDVTNPASYPQCAQNCFKQIAYAGCGSLSNRTCICHNPAFNSAIGMCEEANCSVSEIEIIVDLAEVLCAPVGGVKYATENTSATTSAPSPTVTPFKGIAAPVRVTGLDEVLVVGVGLIGLAVGLL